MAKAQIIKTEDLLAANEWQANHAQKNAAPCTARIIRALPKVCAGNTATGRRIAAWRGAFLKDAVPLRLAGGLHHLVLSGTDARLSRVYSGQITDQAAVDRLVCELVETYDHLLLAWLDGPPQTNEAGRGAAIMAGLLWVARRVGPRLELFELGASAGINTMLDRYHFRLGKTAIGPVNSAMQIAPEWRGERGPPAPPEDFKIVRVRGCDVEPVDLRDPEAALKLKAYVWPDAPGRLARIDAAIELARQNPPDLVRQNADDFVDHILAQPQADGTTRALFHSIMWQYMPPSAQSRILTAMEQAGSAATPDRPLAWVALESDPATLRHELWVRYWNGGQKDGEKCLLAIAHPHAAWVEWLDG